MKKIISIFIACSIIPLVCFGASASVPNFVLTSKCITTIEVKEFKYAPGWVLVLTLNEITALEMLNFSKKYIGKKVRIVDGKGKNIIKNEISVQDHLSSPFQVVGLSTKEEAIKAKKSILETTGQCGEESI